MNQQSQGAGQPPWGLQRSARATGHRLPATLPSPPPRHL